MNSPSTGPELRVLATADEVAAAAADEIARALSVAIDARGVAHWCTTGGSAAPPIYGHLASSPLRESVNWKAVHTWWGDDRFVPYDHPLSNVMPLHVSLIDPDGDPEDGGIAIPPSHLHRVPVPQALAGGTGAAGAAVAYAREIEALVPRDPDGRPVFDLIVLGVGGDGHVLSVFPGSAVWDDPATVVAVPAPTHIEPHVERVTIHPRLLAAAREVLVVTTGASKAANLGRAWSGDDARELPARAARLPGAVWILDEAAAAELPRG